MEARAKALAYQVSCLEAQVKKLEAKLESSRDFITELEEWVGDREAKITNKVKYITLLEELLVESTAITLC